MKKLPTFEELQRPLPQFSPKNWYYAATRIMLNTAGNLSDGIRLGNTYGFDSGVMLDYVYKNRASGKLLMGKLIDRAYLNTVGWRGIRLRKILVKQFIHRALTKQLQHKSLARYLDIACGGGEYDLEVLKDFDQASVHAELRDYKKENLERARQNARQHQLEALIFRQADAFDDQNYHEKWDLAIASGFWEIIADDSLIRKCMQNLASCLVSGGTLIFTIQPYHPQLEFIARALKSNTGKPWVMRLRSLELFKAWLDEFGFRFIAHKMEENEIFGVVETERR